MRVCSWNGIAWYVQGFFDVVIENDLPVTDMLCVEVCRHCTLGGWSVGQWGSLCWCSPKATLRIGNWVNLNCYRVLEVEVEQSRVE